MHSQVVAVAVVVAVSVVPGRSETIHFPDDNPHLEEAIESAAPGDTIVIAPGSYSAREISLASGSTVMSESGLPSSVTLSAGDNGTVFRAHSVTGVVVAGMTLANGYTTPYTYDGGAMTCSASSIELHDVVIEDSYANERGGGMACVDSELVLDAVVFRNNRSKTAGGGLYCSGCDVSLRDCVFESNEVGKLFTTQTTWSYQGKGAGMHCEGGSSVVAQDVTFRSNYTWFAGGGLGLAGGDTQAELTRCAFVDNTTSTDVGCWGPEQSGAALYINDAEATLTDVEFSGNWSYHDGGALYCIASPRITLDECVFSQCEAVRRGGAICSSSSNLTVTGSIFGANHAGDIGGAVWANSRFAEAEFAYCIFTGNEGSSCGGAIHTTYGPVDLANCTLEGNRAVSGSGIYFGFSASSVVTNSILSFGVEGSAVECVDGGLPEITRCCVFGHASGDSLCGEFSDNTFVDPLMCSPSAGDFSLCSNSPCVASNNSWGELVGAMGEGCGPCSSPVVAASWGVIKAMFRGD